MGGIETISANLPLTWTFSWATFWCTYLLWSTLKNTRGESRKGDISFWLRLFDFPIITFVSLSETVCVLHVMWLSCLLLIYSHEMSLTFFLSLSSICSYIIAVRVPPLKHNFPWRQAFLIRSQAFVRRCMLPCSHYKELLTERHKKGVYVLVDSCVNIYFNVNRMLSVFYLEINLDWSANSLGKTK